MLKTPKNQKTHIKQPKKHILKAHQKHINVKNTLKN